jgi:hypothetical protein
VILGLAVLAVTAAGCGSNPYRTAPVSGTVMCNGKPAFGGTIRFRPVDAPEETGRPPGQPGREAFATVEEDGTFTLMMDTAADATQAGGALIGRHEVIFESPRTKPVPIPADDREGLTAAEVQALRADIDRRYPVYQPLACSAEITPREVEVVAGQNVFEFTLSPN